LFIRGIKALISGFESLEYGGNESRNMRFNVELRLIWNYFETELTLCLYRFDLMPNYSPPLSQRPVTVWMSRGLGDSYDDMPLDAGVIEKITPISVKLRYDDGIKAYFMRDNVEFRA
jgi:hypothetical protein